MKNKLNNKFFKYANKYIDLLNVFYYKYKNNIDKNTLDEEYDLMTNILDNLIYDNINTWYIYFGEKQYKEELIYKKEKAYWKVLSKLYKKMWRITKKINK